MNDLTEKEKKERLKQIEEIAEELGIGQKKKVKCSYCKKTVDSTKCVIVKKGDSKPSYLCEKCWKEIKKGKQKVNRNEEDIIEWLRKLEKAKRNNPVKDPWVDVPYTPYLPTNGDSTIDPLWMKDTTVHYYTNNTNDSQILTTRDISDTNATGSGRSVTAVLPNFDKQE